MSMFSDNPRDQEDWTIHVSENKKHDDSKRPLYGASSQQGQTSPSEKQKLSEEKKQESHGEKTKDDRGCFAKCCSWIYRCLRGCVRLAGKRKGSTMTLTASMALASLAQVIATIVLAVDIQKTGDKKIKCGDGDLSKHTPFWIINGDEELRCTWPTNNNVWRGLLSGITLLLTIYVIIGLIRQRFGWFKVVGFLVMAAGLLMLYSFGTDVNRVIKGTKACNNNDFGLKDANRMAKQGSCNRAPFTAMVLISLLQMLGYLYSGLVIMFFKKTHPKNESTREFDAVEEE